MEEYSVLAEDTACVVVHSPTKITLYDIPSYLIPDDLIKEVKDLSHGENITESLIVALKEWRNIQKLKILREKVRKHPLSFKSGYSSGPGEKIGTAGLYPWCLAR